MSRFTRSFLPASLPSLLCLLLLIHCAAPLAAMEPAGPAPGEHPNDEFSPALRAAVPAEAVMLRLPATGKVIAFWEDPDLGAHAGVSLDGESFRRSGPHSYTLKLRAGAFDPRRDAEPTLPPSLRADAAPPVPLTTRDANQIYIVQFMTQPLEEYRRDIAQLGGTIHKFLAHHAYIVRMDNAARDAVAELPYVRWVGAYHPAYRMEEHLLRGLTADGPTLREKRYRIMVFERGPAQKDAVAQHVEALGGRVDLNIPDGFIIEATLSAEQLLEIAHLNEVMFIDRWSAPEEDLDLARIIGGAVHVENAGGYTGAGVRGEVKDGNIFAGHVEFANNPPIIRTSLSGGANHGTSTYGIVFSSGQNDARSRGVSFGAEQGMFSSYHHVSNRYAHTAQLLQAPHFGVFQSNSWGNALTTQYNSYTAEMDDILFNFDVTILQSQSNTGNRSSRPQAWAKNIVSVGGVRHYNTLNRDLHEWTGGASIGPADDGRIKPDLSHFYDMVFTTRPNNAYTESFGGTSAATPITAGYFGVMFEMWNDGIFGNEIDPDATLFENRPRSTTAKALMINTASPYPFSGPDHDLNRVHQGWGIADVGRLYDMRDRIFIIDGSDILSNLQSTTYALFVAPGTDHFRATMVYLDPPGTTSSSLHRINALALKVEAPNGQIFHGNLGLLSGNRSATGGTPQLIDTVQNVFLNNPLPGMWYVTVEATEIVEDAYPDQDGFQATYSLVVSGVSTTVSCPADLDEDGTVTVGDLFLLLSAWGPCEDECPADLTGDGTVDLADLLAMLAAWGPCP